MWLTDIENIRYLRYLKYKQIYKQNKSIYILTNMIISIGLLTHFQYWERR